MNQNVDRTKDLADRKLREAFKKKNCIFNDIDQKGGRGSDQKPNFFKLKK